MDPQEAADYLKSWIGDSEAGAAELLLKELTYRPLEITQAAAYLKAKRVPIPEYLRLLRRADQETASLLSREFYDDTRYRGSQNAVVTTWLVSFDQIRKSDGAAADLLSFLSCIEPKEIPQSILPRFELEEQMVHAVGTLWGYAILTRPVARTGPLDRYPIGQSARKMPPCEWEPREARRNLPCASQRDPSSTATMTRRAVSARRSLPANCRVGTPSVPTRHSPLRGEFSHGPDPLELTEYLEDVVCPDETCLESCC